MRAAHLRDGRAHAKEQCLDSASAQEENMVSSKEVAQKYESFADYEEEFM